MEKYHEWQLFEKTIAIFINERKSQCDGIRNENNQRKNR